MLDNIGGIVIFVSNQTRAIEFYTHKLGFDVKGEYPYKNTKWVEVGPKTSTTTISFDGTTSRYDDKWRGRTSKKRNRNYDKPLVLY